MAAHQLVYWWNARSWLWNSTCTRAATFTSCKSGGEICNKPLECCPAAGDVFALTSLSQLQIDAIIRRARSKVCTRHISAGSIAAFSGDAGDDVQSAAPAESDHGRGFLSPDSTPQRSNPREASRSGVSGACHVAGSQSKSHTQPAPASYTSMGHSAGADDLIRLCSLCCAQGASAAWNAVQPA